MKHMFSLNIFFPLKRFSSVGVRYLFYLLIFTSYSFGQYSPDSVAIQEVAEGLRDNANAIWWGFNSTNVTSNLQAALNSRASKITIPNIGMPWIVDPLWLPSNKQITLESGVVLKARSGSFLGTDDCLLRAYDKQNITIIGYGAQIEMNKDDYTVSPYLESEARHCLSISGCSNVSISGLKFIKSGGDGIYVGRGTINKYSSNIQIKDVVCDNNHRNGISVTSAQNILIENCVLKNTHGTSPQAGIDFEPNLYDDLLTNCTLKKCELSNNEGGINIALLPYTQSSQPVSINIDSCVSQNNNISPLNVLGPNTTVPYLGYIVLHDNQLIGQQYFSKATGLDILYEYPSTNPTIGISQSSLAFGDVIVNTASSEKTYIVQGSNLSPASGNITITPPSGFQVSATSGSGFGSSLNVSYTSGKLSSKTIYVKFIPTAVQSYTGNITNSGGGATTKNVAVTGTGISTTSPMLTLNPTSLSFGTISINTTNQSFFTLSGSYLSPAAGNITITAPTGYTISETSSSGYASSITCAYTGNTLSSRTIYVRFTPTAAQSYIGTITIAGGSATTKNVAVTGTGTTSTTPTLTVSNASLTFGNITINTTRLSSYTISGSNLSPAAGNITITAPTGYTISKTYDSGYASSITCAYTGNMLSAITIYVRFTPTAVQIYTGNITNAGGGATKNVAVSGTGISGTTPVLTVSNTSLSFGNVFVNMTSQSSFTVSGSYLSPAAGNITITAPTGYTISETSSSGYASSITCAYTGNTLSARAIYVRFTPTATQSYTGTITIAGGSATTKNIAVSGTGIPTTIPILTVSNTSLSFGNVFVNTTGLSSFTISGSDLSPAAGNITITAPTGYTVSQTYGSGYASSITCAYTSNTLSARAVYVRFTPTALQSYTGNITCAGGGAITKNIAVTGTGTTSGTAPVLTVSNASLSFGNITINTTRLSSITITGSNLSPAAGNITITAPTGYTVSQTYGSGYASSITCAYTGNTISSKMIYVRFTPTAVQSYTGNITHTGGGATTKNVAVTGTGISGISASIAYSPALITGTLTAAQQTLPAYGGTVTLQWTSQNADSATISPNIGAVSLNGSINVYVTSETQFILTLFNDTTTVQYPLIVRNSITSVNSESVRPKSIELGQNYPNPFNPSTVINYQLSVAGKVRLSVHDILGREIITLVNEEKGAGYYSQTFDGSKLSSGTYITRFIFDPENGKQIVQVKKMLLVK
jgi:hypothetical protein